MSTKHKSINPNSIDFSATSLNANGNFGDPFSLKLSVTDSIEWNYQTAELCTSILVSTVLKWIERKGLHVPEDMEAHECDSLKWLDANFEYATEAYFMDVYAMEESEVGND